jgi:hypothetical protein
MRDFKMLKIKFKVQSGQMVNQSVLIKPNNKGGYILLAPDIFAIGARFDHNKRFFYLAD